MNDREQVIQLAQYVGRSVIRDFSLIREAADALNVTPEGVIDKFFSALPELIESTPVVDEARDTEVLGLSYNASRFEMTYDDKDLALTRDQRKILLLLMKNAGVVVSREMFCSVDIGWTIDVLCIDGSA